MKKIILAGIMLCLSASVSLSADYCIGAAATGSGSGADWSNQAQWSSVSFIRGNTYYVADGTYGGKTFNTALSGTTLITIKKATASSHGTSTGWSAAYGDGVATFTGQLGFTTGYWTFDGVTGGGPGSWLTGFGFRSYRAEYSGTIYNFFINNSDYVTIRHCEIEGAGEDVGVYGNQNHGIKNWGGRYLTVEYCWLHDYNTTMYMSDNSGGSGSADHLLWQYNFVSERHSNTSPSTHGEHMSINFSGNPSDSVIRYNVFRNATNTGTIVIKDSTQSGFKIYGNLFYSTNPTRYYNSNGIIADTGGDSTTSVLIYNNTFLPTVDGNGNPSKTVSFQSSTGNVFKNNVVFASGGISGATRSYNLYDSSTLANGETGGQYWSTGQAALFNDPTTYDLSLKVATTAGDSSIGAEYGADYNGATRGGDSTWDRGALEYGGADATPSAFSFTDVTGAAQSTETTTDPCMTVAGIDADQTPAVSITGAGCTYNVDGGSYTSDAGTVGLDNVVCLRVTSSASYSTTANASIPDCTLNTGGVTGGWTVTTEAAVEDILPPMPPRLRSISMRGGWR